MGSALTLGIFIRIELIVGYLAGIGELMGKCLVFGIRKRNTDLKDFFFFNYSELCFVISEKEKRHYKPQSVARRNEEGDVYKSHSTMLFSNCT